jgi:hypothetical protein
MGARNIRILIGTITLFIMAMPPLAGQLSEGGRPLMNTADFDPGRVLYVLPPLSIMETEARMSAPHNTAKKSLEYAVQRPVDLDPEFNGQWVERNNLRVWRSHIVSAGARSLGILFDVYRLKEGVRLFLYDASGTFIKGAFTARNNKAYEQFFVGLIPGDEVIIELQMPVEMNDYGRIRIGSVSHAVIPVKSTLIRDYPYLGTSQDCEVDVNCDEGDDWQLLKRSVCHVRTPSNLCTGILVNNTAYNGKQYLITAEHCISSDSTAQKSMFIFGYENSDCGVNDGRIDQSLSGATLLSTGDSLDFSLVEIDEVIPESYNVYYAGWDLRAAGFDSTVTLHHPNADAMKISSDFDSVSIPTTVPGTLKDYIIESNYWIRQWDIGSTEGGSSGAPLFNKQRRLIGVLSGGSASCGDSIGYDALKQQPIFTLVGNENDYYSRISFIWDFYPQREKQLKAWLDPLNTGAVSIGGLNPATLGNREMMQADTPFKIYPNPARERIIVQLRDIDNGKIDCRIVDVYGRTVIWNMFQSQDETTIDVSSLLPGIYFIRLSGSSVRGTARFVIQ